MNQTAIFCEQLNCQYNNKFARRYGRCTRSQINMARKELPTGMHSRVNFLSCAAFKERCCEHTYKCTKCGQEVDINET